MDYKRAYNEALDRARQFMSEHPTRAEADLMVALFPELAKSEDEKTAREIKEFILYKAGHLLDEATEHRFIKYLEKQKEPHYTKRNALFDKCVENCDPVTMKSVSDEVDAMLEKEQSEDERIRKAIKCYVEDMPDTYGFAHGIGKKEMLSYLEKQKELTAQVVPGYSGHYFYDGEKLHLLSTPAMVENPHNFAMNQQEKQKECLADNSKTSDSEDERLRKAALKGIEYLEHNLAWDAIGDTDILDVKEYLKKQKVNTEGDFARGYDCGYECCLNSHGAEWFEKQKEQKPKNILTDDDSLQTAYLKGQTDVLEDPEAYGLQKEQKSAERNFPYGVNETVDKLIAIAECLEMDGDCLFNGYSGIECGKFLRDLAKQVECKPAEWNEEDEDMYFKVTTVLNYLTAGDQDCVFAHETLVKLFYWTKSLPERFNLQPKKEWSEDEESLINTSISFLKDFADKGYENAVECIDWLKSKLNGNTCK